MLSIFIFILTLCKISLGSQEKLIGQTQCIGNGSHIAFKADGYFHCIFVSPKVDEIIKMVINGSGYDVDITKAKYECASYNSTLVQVRSRIMHFEFMKRANAIFNNSGFGTSFPLGINLRLTKIRSTEPPSKLVNLDLDVTWGMGGTTQINTIDLYPGEKYFWADAHLGGITYLGLLDGMFRTKSEGYYPVLVKILCHQDPEFQDEDLSYMDICGGEDPEIKIKARFEANGRTHCIFYLPENIQSRVLKRHSSNYQFTNLTSLIVQCELYDSGLLEIRNKDMHEKVLREVKVMDPEHYKLSLPLGITKKTITNGSTISKEPLNQHYKVDGTWENGQRLAMDEESYLSYGIMRWEILSEQDTAFINIPSGSVHVQTVISLQGQLVLLCHQEVSLNPYTPTHLLTTNLTTTNLKKTTNQQATQEDPETVSISDHEETTIKPLEQREETSSESMALHGNWIMTMICYIVNSMEIAWQI